MAVYHGRIQQVTTQIYRAIKFYERGLARVEDRWIGTGNVKKALDEDDDHLYASDLDIFGRGSLFELLCTARTQSGESTLASWLCEPATQNEIAERQEAVKELRDNVNLREELAVVGPDDEDSGSFDVVAKWAQWPPVLDSSLARVAAPAIAVLTLVALFVWWLNGGVSLLGIALAFQVGFRLHYRERVREVVESIDAPARELNILHSGLRILDREQFSTVRLQKLQTEFETTAKPEISWLLNLVNLLNLRHDPWFMILALPFLWDAQLAFAIESWRKRNGGAPLAKWVGSFGQFEAISALSNYTFEHPEDPFPEIVGGDALFHAEELKHPLLPDARCIPNSLKIGDDLQLVVVSGSNMSGKTTLLRAAGINVVLAQAGAPVRAKRLKLSPFSIGATLRVQDSLQGGTSRFYAEIKRLHKIMQLTDRDRPVLFLLDEIFHGTNSHDRAIGAEAIVRGLIEAKAIGLVTTHDLALTKVAETLKPRAANVHLRDHLEDGQMIFDYRLHPGIVQKSNALELMRSVGLKV